MVARELISNRLVRMWQDQLSAAIRHSSLDERTLFVAFYAPAEWGCFAATGLADAGTGHRPLRGVPG